MGIVGGLTTTGAPVSGFAATAPGVAGQLVTDATCTLVTPMRSIIARVRSRRGRGRKCRIPGGLRGGVNSRVGSWIFGGCGSWGRRNERLVLLMDKYKALANSDGTGGLDCG